MNNDLISRKALIKWIDDSVSQYGNTYSTDILNMWGLFKDYLINNAPTVDVDKELERQREKLYEESKKLYTLAKALGKDERPQGESFRIEEGLKKARRGNYVIYDVDFLLDNLAREVNIMESARQWKAGKGNDND